MNQRVANIIFFPYYLVLKIRNWLYDISVIKSKEYDVPIISIGNITMGGTGKTPHSELLIQLLKENYKVALISRGYKRRTKGFRFVEVTDTYLTVGDEPIQIKRKFPDAIVAVDKNRKRAIAKIMEMSDPPQVIVLDDAFQYRKISPSHSILLIDYNRPLYEDSLFPIGKLRDLPSQIKRADIVIVTKCPIYFDDPEREIWKKNLRLRKDQHLLFSTISYKDPQAIYKEGDYRYVYSSNAVLFSGIANDRSLREYIGGGYRLVSTLKYPDHHEYSSSDIKQISNCAIKNPTAVLFTTEKDAQRLSASDSVGEILRKKIFYIPISAQMMPLTDPYKQLIPEEIREIGEKELIGLLGF